jgi:hypothetical protein
MYYNIVSPKRLLKWSFQCSTVEIDAKFSNKTYSLVVNAIQAVILLLFNDFNETEVSFRKILDLSGILTEKELRNNIQPLLACKILIKCDGSEDLIKLNNKFLHSNRRIKLITPQKNDDIIRKEKIEEDRSWAIEATIVRIMKSEKRLNHNELIKRVLEQMEHFKIQIHVKYYI